MSITRLTITFALSLLAAQLASGVAAAACPDPNPGKTHELEFKLKDGKCVEKLKKERDGSDAMEIKVCENDTVQWKVSGKAKLIVFVGGTPFEWAASGFEGNKIEGKVKPGTAGKPPFKYSVYVKDTDCELDPRIIVEP